MFLPLNIFRFLLTSIQLSFIVLMSSLMVKRLHLKERSILLVNIGRIFERGTCRQDLSTPAIDISNERLYLSVKARSPLVNEHFRRTSRVINWRIKVPHNFSRSSFAAKHILLWLDIVNPMLQIYNFLSKSRLRTLLSNCVRHLVQKSRMSRRANVVDC